MKLRDCLSEFDFVYKDPPRRGRAADIWQAARLSGRIPESLFVFYSEANYFSLDAGPPFLSDPGRVLFSYLEVITNGVRESFEEGDELLKRIVALEPRVYTPLKADRSEWDSDAAQSQRRALRYYLLNMSAAMDLFSEAVSLIFAKEVASAIPLGRAHFTHLVSWLKADVSVGSMLAPTEGQLEKLHRDLREVILAEGEEPEWLRLFRLYRNKLTHLGAGSVIDFRLQDADGSFYAFLPRVWPFIWQSGINYSREDQLPPRAKASERLRRTIENNCIHIDLLEFLRNLDDRLRAIVDRGFGVLAETLNLFTRLDLPLNEEALETLQSKARAIEFKDFDDE